MAEFIQARFRQEPDDQALAEDQELHSL